MVPIIELWLIMKIIFVVKESLTRITYAALKYFYIC